MLYRRWWHRENWVCFRGEGASRLPAGRDWAAAAQSIWVAGWTEVRTEAAFSCYWQRCPCAYFSHDFGLWALCAVKFSLPYGPHVVPLKLRSLDRSAFIIVVVVIVCIRVLWVTWFVSVQWLSFYRWPCRCACHTKWYWRLHDIVLLVITACWSVSGHFTVVERTWKK